MRLSKAAHSSLTPESQNFDLSGRCSLLWHLLMPSFPHFNSGEWLSCTNFELMEGGGYQKAGRGGVELVPEQI